jgi:hypothetical protein
MADILLRGMKMPSSCASCPFEVFGDCYGGKVKRIMDIEDYMDRGERHPDCPLHELPPHGDLIDIDKIRYTELYGGVEVTTANWIDSLPVVVPAERREG